MKNTGFVKGLILGIIAIVAIGGIGMAVWTYGGQEFTFNPGDDVNTNTNNGGSESFSDVLSRTIDTSMSITMSDQIRAGYGGAVDARYDYWICKDLSGKPSNVCGTDNTYGTPDNPGPQGYWQYVTGDASQTSIEHSPGDWLMFLVGDDGDANCDTSHDWYKELFFIEVPNQETYPLNFPLCMQANVTVSVINNDGSVNSRSNAEALGTDEEKQMILQITGGTNGCFGSPSEYAGIGVMTCFAVNATTTDKLYLSGAGIDDESAPVPDSSANAADYRDEADYCSVLSKNYIGRNEVLRYTMIFDTDGTTQPAAHNSNVTVLMFDGDGVREKFSGLPIIAYNNASENDVGIGTTRAGSETDTITVS